MKGNVMSSSQSSALEQRFELTKRGSTVRKEIVAGLTTFLAMVYSVIVVPNMLSAAGFPAESVFIATCLVAGLGSLLIGFWANAPMAIGCAISFTAFTACNQSLKMRNKETNRDLAEFFGNKRDGCR